VLSLDDLTTPLTPDDVKRSIYSVLANTGVTTTIWKPGGVVRTIIAGVAIVIASMSVLLSNLAKSGFLSSAAGDWLAQIAKNVFNVVPTQPTFATSIITVDNTGGGIFDQDPGDIQFINPTTKKTYFNTETVHIGSLETGVQIAVQAFEAGSASNSFPGEISQLQTALLGVSISNSTSAVGVDAESDPSIRQRCLDKLGSLSPNGPSDAYAYIARSATRPDGTPFGVTRVRVTNDGYGNVFVYLATASGGVPGTVGDLSTDLGLIDEQLQRMAAPLAVTLHTYTATPVAIPVTYELWLYNASGFTVDQIQEAIAVNLTEFIASQPIGGNVIGTDPGKIFRTALEACIGAATTTPGVPLPSIKVVISVPTDDVALDASQVPVIGTVTPLAIHSLKSTGL
jgi:phage-related baseplate assembly protein